MGYTELKLQLDEMAMLSHNLERDGNMQYVLMPMYRIGRL